MSKPTAASLRYLLPNVSFADSLWHMALTAQPRAKLVKAITSFPSVAKGTSEEEEKKKGKAYRRESLTWLGEIFTLPDDGVLKVPFFFLFLWIISGKVISYPENMPGLL